MGWLEIAISYVCNVKCSNCNALSTQAPTRRKDDMALADIERLVDESVACAYPWTWLKLFGGEPTLHTQFEEICACLSRYRSEHNPRVRLSVVSNGTGNDKVKRAGQLGFDPLVSPKRETNRDEWGNPLFYVPVNVSPADLGIQGTSGCFIPQDCGISLNNLGFWPCSPTGAAARVFHYQAPVKHVQDLTPERLKALYCHCDHCGYAMSQPRRFEQVTSPTWDAKLKGYNARLAAEKA